MLGGVGCVLRPAESQMADSRARRGGRGGGGPQDVPEGPQSRFGGAAAVAGGVLDAAANPLPAGDSGRAVGAQHRTGWEVVAWPGLRGSGSFAVGLLPRKPAGDQWWGWGV